MAGVAIRAVVDVTANALMILIGLTLGMTVGAGEYSVVRGIGVTS